MHYSTHAFSSNNNPTISTKVSISWYSFDFQNKHTKWQKFIVFSKKQILAKGMDFQIKTFKNSTTCTSAKGKMPKKMKPTQIYL